MHPSICHLVILALAALLAGSFGCSHANDADGKTIPGERGATGTVSTSFDAVAEDKRSKPMSITLTSSRFQEGQPIPARHTCDGENLSPPLNWDAVPEATKSFVIICDDPDAPARTWVHWVIFDIPPTVRNLAEGVKPEPIALDGTTQGQNDFKDLGYGGPCPPKGAPHRYIFKIYALDRVLQLQPAATKGDVERAMKGHILAAGKLMGTYKRK